MTQIPLTKKGAELLKAELHRLKTVDRIETSRAIGEARLQGDISENAEYEAAKEKQSFIEGRIQEIEGKLGSALVIDPTTTNAEGKVVFGATVEYEDCDTEKKSTYQIVGEDEADFKVGKISIGSPLARAFIGKRAGDVVEVQAPGGARDVEILSVRYV
jgi:transcription elongation factor GreA